MADDTQKVTNPNEIPTKELLKSQRKKEYEKAKALAKEKRLQEKEDKKKEKEEQQSERDKQLWKMLTPASKIKKNED